MAGHSPDCGPLGRCKAASAARRGADGDPKRTPHISREALPERERGRGQGRRLRGVARSREESAETAEENEVVRGAPTTNDVKCGTEHLIGWDTGLPRGVANGRPLPLFSQLRPPPHKTEGQGRKRSGGPDGGANTKGPNRRGDRKQKSHLNGGTSRYNLMACASIQSPTSTGAYGSCVFC